MTSFSENLSACSCIGQRTVKEEIKHSNAVIVGIILSKELVTITDSTFFKMFSNDSSLRNSPMANMTIAKYELLVQDLYKGKISKDTVIIYTGLGGGDCGFRFEIGNKYIVYGESETYFGQVNNDFKFPKQKNTYWTYICLRTTPYLQEEIEEIEKFAKRKQRTSESTVIFIDPDIPPVFKNGGDIGLQKFINENLHYPKTGECISGKVYVGFTVDTNGLVKDTEIKRGITTSSNEEAIRIVKLMKFKPGTRNGKPIEVEMIVPINFTIDNKNEEK